ncbi:hypothetical protein [Bacillus pseudomycoides]|uniref:hypothetical protein n=1 Tax=Bacillus pseudomycoides TaxID=64104 RepID=UPI000BF1682F|nr:hypothetical protein [Bacillus pseudomycoides]PEM69338.1 hypothetical protein CN619_21630 [Bacillus pseudomycoides]PGA62190.1 hypothetical protein COL84_13525 [Bacillus pseudomycoides]
MKNIFSAFTKKGINKKKSSDFIGVAGKSKQTYMYKNILEELSNSETLNRHSVLVGRTDNGLSRF